MGGFKALQEEMKKLQILQIQMETMLYIFGYLHDVKAGIDYSQAKTADDFHVARKPLTTFSRNGRSRNMYCFKRGKRRRQLLYRG